MPYVNDTGYPSVTEFIKPYVDTRWFTEEHSQRGTAVHDAMAAHLQALYHPPLPAEWQPYYDSGRRWCDENVDKVLMVEKRLVDPGRRYCGQLDLLFLLRHGPEDPCLVDWKTSQQKYRWWIIQKTGYYELVINQTEYKKIARVMSGRLKKDGSGVLIDKCEIGPLERSIFYGMVNAHHYLKET